MGDVALVTGGSGYFGALLVTELLARGRRVRVFDLVGAADRPEAVEFTAGDIRRASDVRRALRDVSVVYHNVAQVPLARDRALFESVNVGGTQALLLECERAGVAKVIYTSSSAVFGVPVSNPVRPDTPPRPVEPYGRAKYHGELLCRAAASRGLDVTIVRPRTILGDGRLGIFSILFDWIADGAAIPVMGDGANAYQFVHARDLVSACILAAERPGPRVYNIGAEEFGTMREALEHLCLYAGTGARVRSLPIGLTSKAMRLSAGLRLTPFAPYHWMMYSKDFWFDVSAAKRDLGWKAEYSTDAAMRESYDWFLAHRDDPVGVGASSHRSPAKQGVLAIAKHLLR